MDPKQPLGPLTGLTLLTFGALLLAACFSAAEGPGRRDPARFDLAAQTQPAPETLHRLPAIPFGR